MSTPTPGPAALLRRLVESDPGRPRITVYDDTDSPTRGERIELSARVLANWVTKAANALQDELDVGVGTVVRLDLPPHWRTAYWALAAWSVGACVESRAPGGARGADGETVLSSADVVVTDDPGTAEGAEEGVLVTLAALARSAPGPVAAGVWTRPRRSATHGDQSSRPGRSPTPGHRAAQRRDDGLRRRRPRAARPVEVHTTTNDTADFLRTCPGPWAADGSVVLSRGRRRRHVLRARRDLEGVTRDAA